MKAPKKAKDGQEQDASKPGPSKKPSRRGSHKGSKVSQPKKKAGKAVTLKKSKRNITARGKSSNKRKHA